MLQIFAEHRPTVMTALWSCGLISGVLLVGLTQQRNSPMNPEEASLHRRQTKGGNVFNDYLWEMKSREERRQEKFARRLADPDTSDEDRRIYAEEIANCQRQLDIIYRMLMMKDPQ